MAAHALKRKAQTGHASTAKRGPAAGPARSSKAPKAEWTFAGSLAAQGSLGGVLQPELEVGPANDEFEQEADRVADRIVTMPAGAAPGGDDEAGTNGALRRKPVEKAGEADDAPEGGAAMQRLAALQRACNTCEAESDELPSPMQRQAEQPVVPASGIKPGAPVQRSMSDAPSEEALQRECTACDDPQKSKRVQRDDFFEAPPPEPASDDEQAPPASRETARTKSRRSRAERTPPPVPTGFRESLDNARRGGGQPLPRPLRDFMESRFGRTFERVRLHYDATATRLADAIQARAFTIGRHVFVRQGDFQPGTQQGHRLVAHELTHVLQQRGGLHRVQRELFEGESTPASAEPSRERAEAAETLNFEQLAKLFGWREKATPPLVLEVVKDLVATALNVATSRESLAAFTQQDPADNSIRRTLRSSNHELRLEANRGDAAPTRADTAPQTRWVLTFFDGSRVPAESGPPIPIGTDEDAIRVSDSGHPPSPAKPAADASSKSAGAPGVAPPSAASTNSAGSGGTASSAKPGTAAPQAGQPDAQSPATAPAPSTGAPDAEAVAAAPTAAEGPFPASPDQDPNFQAVAESADHAASTTSEHAEGSELASNAKDAATVNPGEQQSKAEANKTDQMQSAKTTGFNKAAFVKAVLDKVRATAPNSLPEASNFKRDHGKELGDTVNQSAATQTDATAANLKAVTDAAPNTAAVAPRPTVPLKAEAIGAPPAGFKAERAVPPERPPSQVEDAIQQNQTAAKTQLDALGYSNAEETFAKSNDPELLGTLDAKKAFDADATTAASTYRAGEETLRTDARADASALGQEKLAGMFGSRQNLIGQVATGQRGGKTSSETKRAAVVTEVNRIFTSTESKVKSRLNALKETVFGTFQSESQKAAQARSARPGLAFEAGHQATRSAYPLVFVAR